LSINWQFVTPEQLCLQFFDIKVRIRSDSKDFIGTFRLMYRRFEVSESGATDKNSLEFVLLKSPGNPWGRPVLLLGDDVWPYHDPVRLENYAYEVVLSRILAEVRSYFLIHAAVVSWQDRGVIISADSGHGKTTLALRLALDGYKYLSDEIAAVSRSDRLVHPFLRSVRVRSKTLDIIGHPELARGAAVWGDKLLLDIEDIVPGSIGNPARIDHVFIIKAKTIRAGSMQQHSDRDLGILLNQLDSTILDEIAKIDGIESVQEDSFYGYPLIQLSSSRRMSVLKDVEDLSNKHGILILDVYKRELVQPEFDQAVDVIDIPGSQAAMQLLRQFQPGHRSNLLREELLNSPSRLYVELARLIDRAACYQLTPGPLEQMIEIIKGKVI
jgi:hypothetical protein